METFHLFRLLPKIIGVLAVVLLASCSHQDESEAEAVAPVQVAPVERGVIHRIVEADAVLFPLEQSNVTPKISAPVQKFYVNRGDSVKAGQLLATLENRDLTAASAAAKGQLDQASANLRNIVNAQIPEDLVKAQADVESAQQQLAAAQKLVESREELLKQGALARRLVDEAKVQLAQAKAAHDSAVEHLRALEGVGKREQVATARAQVDTAEAQHHSAEAQVGYSEVRSPISGVISDRPLWEGEMANAGSPLLTIMNISTIVARANVPQDQAPFVKVGDAATIALAEAAQKIRGKVTVVSPATDPDSTTVQVWVQAGNPRGLLKPGATVHVSIMAQTIEDAVIVPASAIISGDENAPAVLTVDAALSVHQKGVKLGLSEGDKVQILEGVSPGEQVVVVGGVGLEDNATVRIVKPGEQETPALENGSAK